MMSDFFDGARPASGGAQRNVFGGHNWGGGIRLNG
jgi:hypothetical protein